MWIIEGLYELLGAFAKLGKGITSFFMPVRLSVRMEQFGSHWQDFKKYDISEFFENLAKNFKFTYNRPNWTVL